MVIPSAFESNEIKSVCAHLETLQILDLPPLERDDLSLIGAFIQTFNFIEFNLRRSIEIFCEEDFIRRKKIFHQNELVPTLKKAISHLCLRENGLKDIHEKLDEIESRRSFRNLLAHSSGKRVPESNAFVFLSMNSQDTDFALMRNVFTKDFCMYAVVMRSDLMELLLHISEYDKWLAQVTSSWSRQFSLNP